MELDNVAGLRMNFSLITPDRRQSKTFILSTNIDQKLLETVFLLPFLICICQLLRAFSIAVLSGVLMSVLTAGPGIGLVYSNRKINYDQ